MTRFKSYPTMFAALILFCIPLSTTTANDKQSGSVSLDSSDALGYLDIDGNGQTDALTDGLLILRYMFGLTGNALVTSAISTDASYTVHEDIHRRILDVGLDLDVDNNGEVDALTDGLIILRYLFGLRGEVLIDGVISANAERLDVVDVETYLIDLTAINYSLAITSSQNFIIPENQMFIGSITAQAPRGLTLDYSIMGYDAEQYNIVISDLGEMSFATVMEGVADYEIIQEFTFVVEVTDGIDTIDQAVVLTITDVDESIDGINYQADPVDDPEHVPGRFYARHCVFDDNFTGEERRLSDVGLSSEELLTTYTNGQIFVIPGGDINNPSQTVPLWCNADWDMEFAIYSSGWAGQERGDLGIYGYSSFSRITQDLTVRPESQAGVWGQWMQPRNSHPYSAISTIEGGLFSDDKMGRSYYPKYMASGATHYYNPNSSIFGWGFYEARVTCDYYGAVQIANTMVLPPNLISFDEDQDPHINDGGMFFGHAWMALPFIGGKERSNWTNKGGNEDLSLSLGKLSWTFFAEAKNFSGPIYAYVPEMWYRRLDRWNAMEVMPMKDGDDSGIDDSHEMTQTLKDFLAGRINRDDLLDVVTAQYWYADGVDNYVYGREDIHYWTRAKDTLAFTPVGGVSIGAERDATSVFKETDQDGNTYIKTFIPPVPRANNLEPFTLSNRTYGVESYNYFLEFFQGQSAVESLETNLNSFSYPTDYNEVTENVTLPGEIKLLEDDDVERLTFRTGMTTKTEFVNGGVDIYYDWKNIEDREYSQYYKVITADTPADYRFIKVTEDSVPETLKVLTYGNKKNPYSLMPHVKTPTDKALEQSMKTNTKEIFGYDSEPLDFSCWVCDEENGCDPTINTTTMDDGSIVKFRWYRFKDQPTFQNLIVDYPEIYTDAYLNTLQSRVEDIHEHWIDKDTDFLSRPDSANGKKVNFVELDHGHIVMPPAGKEKGWVPIVISVEMPYGKWIDDLHLNSYGNRKIINGY